jgi:hypothetical protein
VDSQRELLVSVSDVIAQSGFGSRQPAKGSPEVAQSDELNVLLCGWNQGEGGFAKKKLVRYAKVAAQ